MAGSSVNLFAGGRGDAEKVEGNIAEEAAAAVKGLLPPSPEKGFIGSWKDDNAGA